MKASLDRALTSMFKTFLPIVGKIYPYLFRQMKLLPLDASAEEIEQYQHERLQEVVKLASQTPFYKRKFLEFGVNVERVEKVSNLKFRVTREDVEKYQHLMRRKGVYLTFKAYTSGSTGKPLGMAHSYRQLLQMPVFLQRFSHFVGSTRKDNVMILFPEAASSFFAVAMGLSFCGFSWNAANYFDLDDQLRKLQRADVVFGHGTKILDLIQKAKERHLKNLRSVMFTAEPIVQSGKEYIEEKTSAKVYGIYATIEAMGPIAISCINGNYHLMPEIFIMETTGENDVLLSMLDPTRATILLRYYVGDKAFWTKCACGCAFPAFNLEPKFKHLTSQRIEEAICSSDAFKKEWISPYFDYKTEVTGSKRKVTIYLEEKVSGHKGEIASEIKNIIIYGNKKQHLQPIKILFESGVLELEIRFVKKIYRVKNPRFW